MIKGLVAELSKDELSETFQPTDPIQSTRLFNIQLFHFFFNVTLAQAGFRAHGLHKSLPRLNARPNNLQLS